MDAQTVEAILKAVFNHFGLVALVGLFFAAMLGVSVAQMIQMKRWQPQTAEIAGILRDIAGKLEAQHATCTQHYGYAQRQIEGMASISHELKSVVDAISDSDKARTSEIMQLMTVIASRAK